MTWPQARRIRQAVQILFVGLFVGLLLVATSRPAAVPLADIFFRFNPLPALGAMLASRAWIPHLGLALLTLGLTLVLGRVWCGWICPLGALLEWVSFPKARRRGASLSIRWRNVKYLLLALVVVMAALGNLSLLILDPLALFTRAMTTAVLPAVTYGVNALETALYPIQFVQPAIDWVESGLRGPILPVHQPAFRQNILIATLFGAILALNALAHRFWCRYLCPLGALLGLLSRVSLLRPVIGSSCNHCVRCVGVCRPGAIETRQQTQAILPSECTVCLDCLAACPETGVVFQASLRPAPAREFDLSRRQALSALALGTAGVLLLRTQQRHPLLIRPPGAQGEATFRSRCLRCAQCMKVCPTTGLQPALVEAGWEGLWTPVLQPRVGYCDYSCNACGQVCPSGAIPRLTLDEKRQALLGQAAVDRDRCLPWASGVPCIVCEEMCPTPQKAIRLEEATVVAADGLSIVVQRPSVLRELCIGCGICENRCPLEGDAAIHVYGIT